jgi:hypothetical protein
VCGRATRDQGVVVERWWRKKEKKDREGTCFVAPHLLARVCRAASPRRGGAIGECTWAISAA